SMEPKKGEAKVQKVKNWSPVWIFPIVTALIGAWILFYHYSHQVAFTQQALNMGWHLRLRTDVAENEARLPHRVLLAFSPQAGECF
ncbi:hypothetical protein MJM83_29995, partial [Salmonella enterica subsp. enterica serovar Montevideo]|nr:hypothetical protein [Salmonella enterica subsp. enterica serovar Montevideo]